MKMKMNSLAALCLSLLLLYIDFSVAKRGGGGFGKSFSYKKLPTSNKGSTHTNTNTGHRSGHGSSSSSPNQSGGYPVQGKGRPGYRGAGGYATFGGRPGGGHINHNPKNKVLSPRYGGSFGYAGYSLGLGSPFSQQVQSMEMYPSDRSRGFGRSAVMAAAGGAMAGMAVGYGLGRFPRPHFHFHSRQEEHYYNHYMYRRYGVKSTDTNDYSRDYKYTQPAETYDSYMDSCMNRTDVLSAGNKKPNAVTSSAVTVSNTKEAGRSASQKPPAASTQRPVNQPEANPLPAASQAAGSAEDDDTVSIVEIGYPALITQLKARRCLEMYMDYMDKYLKKVTGGAQGLEMSLHGLLVIATGTLMTLWNNNMLVLQH